MRRRSIHVAVLVLVLVLVLQIIFVYGTERLRRRSIHVAVLVLVLVLQIILIYGTERLRRRSISMAVFGLVIFKVILVRRRECLRLLHVHIRCGLVFVLLFLLVLHLLVVCGTRESLRCASKRRSSIRCLLVFVLVLVLLFRRTAAVFFVGLSGSEVRGFRGDRVDGGGWAGRLVRGLVRFVVAFVHFCRITVVVVVVVVDFELGRSPIVLVIFFHRALVVSNGDLGRSSGSGSGSRCGGVAGRRSVR